MTDNENIAAQFRRWNPSAFVKVSFALHAGAAAGAVLSPANWPWALGAVAANQALLTAAGMLPRCALLGPNWTRLPAAAALRGEVAVTIDDGPDPKVTPAVLEILDRHRAKASFFCIGQIAARNPNLCREIVRAGHAVENHGQHHYRLFAALGMRGMASEIAMAQDTLAAIAGSRPRFFRPTAGLRSPLLDPVLARQGVTLASWTRRGFDTRNTNPDSVARTLLRGLKGGDILLLHDGNAARTLGGEPVILKVLPVLLRAIADAGLRTVTLREALP